MAQRKLRDALFHQIGAERGVDPALFVADILEGGGPVQTMIERALARQTERQQQKVPLDAAAYDSRTPGQKQQATDAYAAADLGRQEEVAAQAEAIKYNVPAPLVSPVTALAQGGKRILAIPPAVAGLVTNNDRLREGARNMVGEANQLEEVAAQVDPSTGARIFRGITGAIPQIAPAIVPGLGAVGTASTAARLAAGGVAVGAPETARVVQEAPSTGAAIGAGTGHVLIDALTGASGIFGVEAAILAKNVLAQGARRVVARIGVDLTTEEAQALATAVVDQTTGVDPTALTPERLEQLMLETAVTSLGLSTGMAGGQAAFEKLAQRQRLSEADVVDEALNASMSQPVVDNQHGHPVIDSPPGENATLGDRAAEPSAEETQTITPIQTKAPGKVAPTPEPPSLFKDLIPTGAQEAPTHVEENYQPTPEDLDAARDSDDFDASGPDGGGLATDPGQAGIPAGIVDGNVAPEPRTVPPQSEGTEARDGGPSRPAGGEDAPAVAQVRPVAPKTDAAVRPPKPLARPDESGDVPGRPDRTGRDGGDRPVLPADVSNPVVLPHDSGRADPSDTRTPNQRFNAGLSDSQFYRLRELAKRAKGTKVKPGSAAEKKAYYDYKRELGWNAPGEVTVTPDPQQRIEGIGRDGLANNDGPVSRPTPEVARAKTTPDPAPAKATPAAPPAVAPEHRRESVGVPPRDDRGFYENALDSEGHKRDVERARGGDFEAGKRVKGTGFKAAAERRARLQGDSLEPVEGGLTGKELAAKREKREGFYAGRTVEFKGKKGTAMGVHFGRVKVKFEDGSVKSIPADEVTKLSVRSRGFKTLDNRESGGHVAISADTARNLPRISTHTKLQQSIIDSSPINVTFSDALDPRVEALHHRDRNGNHSVIISTKLDPKEYHRVLGHELMHAALDEMPIEDKRDILDLIHHTMLSEGKLDAAIDSAKGRWGDDKSVEDLMEEIFSDYSGDLHKNGKFLQTLAGHKPGIISKIMDKISDFIDRLLGRAPTAAEQEIRELAGDLQKMLLPAAKEAAAVSLGAPPSIDTIGRNATWVDAVAPPGWVGDMLAKREAMRKEMNEVREANGMVKLSIAKLKAGESDSRLPNGAKFVNHLTHPGEYMGEARRVAAVVGLGGHMKAFEHAVEFQQTPGMVAWKHPGESRDVYEAIRQRPVQEGLAQAQAEEHLKPFTALKRESLEKVTRFLLDCDKKGRELEQDPAVMAKFTPEEQAGIKAWRDTMKWAMSQRAAMLWRMVGLTPAADPLDAAALRKQIQDDEHELDEYREEKTRLSRKIDYWSRKANTIKDPKKLQKAIFERDAANRLFSGLGEFETTDGQPLGVHKMRVKLGSTLEELAEANKSAYVPHSWFGDMAHVSVKDTMSDGVVEFRKVSDMTEMKQVLDELNAKYTKGYTITAHDIVNHPEIAAISEGELHALGKLAGADPKLLDEFLGDGVAAYLNARSSFSGHFNRRSGVKGFSEDLKHVGANYGVSTAKWLANTQLRIDTKPLMESMAKKDVKLHKFWTDHVGYVLHPTESKLTNLSKAALFHMYLGGINVVSPMFNLTQNAFVTLPVMSAIGGMRGATEVLKAQRALAHMLIRVASGPLTAGMAPANLTKMAQWQWPEHKADLQWAEDSHIIEGRQFNEFSDLAQGLTKNTKGEKLKQGIGAASGFLFSTTEKTNRIATFVAALKTAQLKQSDPGFWRRLETMGFHGEQTPRRAAAFLVDTTQYVYGKENRAHFQKGATGVAFAMKSYLVNTYHLMYRLLRAARKGDDKARFTGGLAMMMGMLGSMAGAFGSIPLLGDIIKKAISALLEEMTGDDLEKNLEKILPPVVAQSINKGVPRALADNGYLPTQIPDLGARASVGNVMPSAELNARNLLLPVDAWMRGKEALFGISADDKGAAAADRIPGAVPALRNMWTRPSEGDLQDLVRSLARLNRGAENLTQGLDFAEHGVGSTMSGRPLIPLEETTTSDAVWRSLGANTVHVSQAHDRAREKAELAEAPQADRQHYLGNIVEAVWQQERATTPEEKARWDKELEQQIKYVTQHNAEATAAGKFSEIIKIQNRDVQKGLRDRKLGIENPYAVPKNARPEFFKALGDEPK